jgi:hypothetical protein
VSSLKLLRGVRALLTDAVEHGSRAVETIQLETAKRPFTVLEAIAPLSVPAKTVHVFYDAAVNVTHASIRGVNGVVGVALDAAIDLAEKAKREDLQEDGKKEV